MNVLVFVLFAFFIPNCLSDLDKAIGESCSATKDCAIAYSICDKDSKKCVCMKGFKNSSTSNCEPPKLACPSWDGSPTPTTIAQPCEWDFNQTIQKEFHTCKDNEFCFRHPKTFKSNGKYVHIGHCCPKVPEKAKGLNVPCPLTVNNPNAFCVDTSHLPADGSFSEKEVGNCSFATEECVRVNDKFACCPQPCIGVSSHFSSEGKCYDTASIGEPCKISAQCGGGSFCKASDKDKSKSTCQCKGKVNQSPTPHCENEDDPK